MNRQTVILDTGKGRILLPLDQIKFLDESTSDGSLRLKIHLIGGNDITVFGLPAIETFDKIADMLAGGS